MGSFFRTYVESLVELGSQMRAVVIHSGFRACVSIDPDVIVPGTFSTMDIIRSIIDMWIRVSQCVRERIPVHHLQDIAQLSPANHTTVLVIATHPV